MTFVLIYAAIAIAIIATIAVATRGGALADVEMRFASPLLPEKVREQGLSDFLEFMAHEGYALSAVGEHGAVFRRRNVPSWAWYVAGLLYPLGLLAFLRRKWIVVRVAIAPSGDGSAMVVSGTLTKRLRDQLKDFLV